jgi:hypothetical protein
MKFSAVLAAGVFALSSLVSAQTTVDLSQVYVDGISYGGTGCPQKSVGILLSNDKKTFTLLFDSYVAEIGPQTRITATRKNCQITVNLHYPQGFQYSLLSTDYRGYVGIDKGVTATQKSTYYFSGDQAQASTETKFVGPQSKTYLIHDEIPFTSTVWAPCGQVQALNINSQILLTTTDSKAEGLLTTDSIDGKVSFILGLQWQACPKK